MTLVGRERKLFTVMAAVVSLELRFHLASSGTVALRRNLIEPHAHQVSHKDGDGQIHSIVKDAVHEIDIK